MKNNDIFKKFNKEVNSKVKIEKFLKKSKLSFLSILIMLVIAGYINYEYNPEREKNLGQTLYVNGKDSGLINVDIYEEIDKENKESILNSNGNVSIYDEKEIFNYVKDKDKYETSETIAVFKNDRDNMFSEMSTNYEKIINSSNTNKEVVNEYQKKLDNLLGEKNLIKMVENIIKSEGIEEVVIIPSSGSYNIVIKSSKKIEAADIAKIKNLIVDRFGVDSNKVTVTVEE